MPDQTDKEARNAWLRALQRTATIPQNPTVTLPVVIDRLAEAHPDAPALIDAGETLTYRALAGRSRGYAGWATRNGIGKGDVVCLFMRNCAEYMAIWLGVTRLGGVVALINTQLSGDALIHAIDIVSPRHVIVGPGLAEAVAAVQPRLRSDPAIWTECEPADEIGDIVPPTLGDRALCIYTSGTTGKPKAVIQTPGMAYANAINIGQATDLTSEDTTLNYLPLFHTAGINLHTLPVLIFGGSVRVLKKFEKAEKLSKRAS